MLIRLFLGLVGAVFLFPSWAAAIDTVEPFGKGASDFELYIGADRIGRNKAATGLGASFQLGYGLSERLSAYLNGTAETNPNFLGGGGALGLGLYGTVVDTSYFDLDVFLDFGLSISDVTAFQIAPGLELNVDIENFGVFMTAWEVLSGRKRPVAQERQAEPTRNAEALAGPGPLGDLEQETAQPGEAQRVFDTELSLGVFWNVAEGHQLLLLHDASVHHVPEPGQAVYEVGGLGLGYNVVVYEGIELIHEVSCDIPQTGEQAAFGASIGILATLP